MRETWERSECCVKMAAAGLCSKLFVMGHDRTMIDSSCVLEALRSSPKSRLTYDYGWKPTRQALDDCSKPPLLSPELLCLNLDSSTRLEEQNGCSFEDNELHTDGSQHYSDEELFSSNNFPSGVDSDLKKSKTAELHQMELQASYDASYVAIHKYNTKKEQEAKERSQLWKKKLEEHSKQLQEEKRRYLQEKERERVREFIKSVQAIQEDEKRKSEEARECQQALEKSHKEYAERAVRKVREVEALRLKVLQEEQKNKKHLQELAASFNNIQVTALNIQQIFQGCKFKSFLPLPASELLDEVNNMLQVSQDSLDQAHRNGKPTVMNVKIMQECIGIVSTLLQKAKALVHKADTKAAKEEAEHQAKEEAKRKLEDEKRQLAEKSAAKSPTSSQQLVPVANQQASTAAVAQKSGISKELALCISDQALTEYSKLDSCKTKIIEAAEPLSTDTTKQIKQYKFDLHKAVTTPINAISDQSPRHLLDKIERLTKLLSGQPVSVGGKQISTASHPAAQAFCRELLARKLVQQGSQQVSSSHNSAFPIAAVAIGIWSTFPDVGELILAQFYEQCPFLVPFYIPKTAGLSDTEYFASLGYHCSDGEVEQQDKFLKRMTGLVRLYAAVISSTPPLGQSRNHAHGLDKGWTWLARLMNLDPRPDYTATALYEFLAVAGHALMKEYRKQFGKLLTSLVTEYVPKIEKVTAKTQMGPVVRLRVFLDDCLKNQRIPPPDGFLTPQWWRNSAF